MSSTPVPSTPFLVCRSGARLIALPLQHVQETMRALPLDRVPEMPVFLLGLSVIRGQAVPVLDLGCLTGDGTGAGAAARLVTLALGARRVALAVDAVLGVQQLAPEALGEVPPLLQGAAAGLVAAIGTHDSALLLVLRDSHLVPDSLWQALAERADAP